MAEEGFFEKIRTKLTRQGDVVANGELYVRRTDPQTDAINKAEGRALFYEKEAQTRQERIDALTRQVCEIKKKTAAIPNKTSDAYKKLATEGSRLLTQCKQLETEIVQSRQRAANFRLGAENLKKQKREAEDVELLRELNVRMAMGQEKIDVADMKDVMGEARHTNREVAKTSGILDGALELDPTSPEEALADFEAFELDDAVDMDETQQVAPQVNTNAASSTKRSILDEY